MEALARPPPSLRDELRFDFAAPLCPPLLSLKVLMRLPVTGQRPMRSVIVVEVVVEVFEGIVFQIMSQFRY